MALRNEILVGRFNRALQKLLGIKGGVPAPQVASEFQPIIQQPLGTGDLYLWGYDQFGFAGTQAGAAGVKTAWVLRNPTTSKAVAEVSLIQAVAGAAALDQIQVQLGPNEPDQANIATVNAWDPRGRKAASCILSSGTALGTVQIPIITSNLTSGAWTNMWSPWDWGSIPILPGMACKIVTTTANNNLSISIWWRERPLEDSELA